MLQVIAPAPFGGAETVLRSLAHSYPGEGRVAALLQQGGVHAFVELLKADGLPVAELRCGRRRYDREVRALVELMRVWTPDVVHTHVYHADFVGYFAARRCGVATVAHMHGIPGGDLKDRIYQGLDLRLLRRFDAVVCVSDPLRQRVLAAGSDPGRVHLVPNPYSPVALLEREEARAHLGMQSNRQAVGWIGRMRAEKGVDLFLRAFARVAQPRPQAVLVGDGADMPMARRLVAELDLEADVVFAGERPDAGTLLNAFDTVVISSRNEGLPMVLLEAMGAQLPVVAFAVGGIPDALSAETGWLVAPGDLDAMAAALQAVVGDPAAAARRGAAARSLVEERYGRDRWAERIHDVHRAVLARSRVV